MTQSQAKRFMDRYTKVWADITPSAYAALYHPEGSILLQDGGEVPQPQIETFMEQVIEAVPDLRLVVKRWATSGDALLFEWEMEGTAQGGKFKLRGCDRFTLLDGLAIESVAYYDPSPLTAHTSPEAVRATLRVPVPRAVS